MNFQSDKCKGMHCKMHNQVPSNYSYTLSGIELKYTCNEKDFGVLVIPHLNWNNQHRKLLNRASQRIGLLRRNCSFSKNIAHRKTLYLAISRSQFEHCSQIWRPVNKTNMEKFESMQKRAIKWIFDEDFCWYSKTEYYQKLRKLDILPMAQKFDMNDLTLFHKIFYYPTAHLCLPRYLQRKEVHDPLIHHNTRTAASSDELQLKCNVLPRINAFKFAFFFRSTQIWNQLPHNIRETKKCSIFKCKLKGYLWIKAEETYCSN